MLSARSASSGRACESWSNAMAIPAIPGFAIARLLLKSPPIVVLDEATAHLLFQRLDLPAHRRLGEEQILRGEGDAHAPPHGDEAAQKLDRGNPGKRN